MRVLFITRKYPPQVGGMEQFSYGLIKNFPEQKKTIILDKSQHNLWWWLPYAALLGIIKGWTVDLIHLGDVVLTPVGRVIKFFTGKPVVVTAHGLDVIYSGQLFQKLNLPALRKMDKVICVSRQTVQECLKRGVEEKKIVVIPNGIDVNKFRLQPATSNLQPRQKTIITVGRLVKRKGVNWFVRKVMPNLPGVEYLIIGSGPEAERIVQSIKEFNLADRVKMLGKVSDADLKKYYNAADLFVMPNIKVEGDREGFGIVLLEAASVGLPVVASNLEGIKDAIQTGRNGWLVEWGNAQSFLQKINELLNYPQISELRQQIQEYTINHYSWNEIAQRYLEEFKKIDPLSASK